MIIITLFYQCQCIQFNSQLIEDTFLSACLHGVGDPVQWGWFLLFSRSGGHKTKETYPTRPGSPTPCKQGLREVIAKFVVILGINTTSDISKLLYVISRDVIRRVKLETILKYHEWYLCQISRPNHTIICLHYYPQKVCNFHMQVFQITLTCHCSKPIIMQKFLMQQWH